MSDQGRQLRPDEIPVYVVVNGRKLVAGRSPAFEKVYGKIKPKITQDTSPPKTQATFGSDRMCEDERDFWGVPAETPEGSMCLEERRFWGISEDDMCDEERAYYGIDDDLPFDHPDRVYIETDNYRNIAELDKLIGSIIPELNKRYYYLEAQKRATEFQTNDLLRYHGFFSILNAQEELTRLRGLVSTWANDQVMDRISIVEGVIDLHISFINYSKEFSVASVERNKAYRQRDYLTKKIWG